MGLDTTHDCWHGSYGYFMMFREAIAEQIGFKLKEMHGFGGKKSWGDLPDDALHILLDHSDCDGEINNEDCLPVAERLEAIADNLPGEFKEKALQFAKGLRAAAEAGEDVEFH